MNLLKRAAAVVLSAATVLGCASCGENTANAMTIDGKDVRAGIYLYYVINAYNDAISLTSDDGEAYKDAKTTADVKKHLDKANIDDIHADEWIQNKAVEYCQSFVAVNEEFDRLELKLTGEELAKIDSAVAASMNTFGKFYKETGIGEQSVRDIITMSYKEEAVWNAYYGEGGSEGVEEKTLYDHYAKNHFRLKWIEMPLKDGEGNLLKADGKEEIEKMAQDYMARLAKKSGDEQALMEEFDYLIDEHNHYVTSLSEAAITTTDDEGNQITTETTPKATTTEATTTDATASGADSTDQTTTEAVKTSEGETTTTTAADDQSGDSTTTTTAVAGTDSTDGTTSESTTTTTTGTGKIHYSTDKERVLAVSTSASEKKEGETETEAETEPTYTPCEKVYKWAVAEGTKYNTPEFIKDDECYYIAIKMDIEDRMTVGDLWTSSAVESVRSELYRDKFQEMINGKGKALEVKRNEKAFKRYSVLDVDVITYQQLVYQSYYSMYGMG